MTLNVGTGKFRWDDNTGRSDPDKPVDVYYYRPDEVTANTPVWIIMHGTGRNADDYRKYFVDAAREQGALVIAPRFIKDDWSGSTGYNLGNISASNSDLTPVPEQDWSFSKIEPLFDYVVDVVEPTIEVNKYYMFGHSAGAQFVHRFLAWKPDARVKLAVAANAGWYTVPQSDGVGYQYDWPYSTSKAPDYNASTEVYDPFPLDNLDNFLTSPLVVLLGEDDKKRTSNLRTTKEADRQGRNRFERGQFFYSQGQDEAQARGVDFGWELQTVPGVGHDGEEMAIPAAELFRLDNEPPVEPSNPPTDTGFYFSLHNSGQVGGVNVEDEDIVYFDGNNTFTKYFDGSKVGLRGLEIDAFDLIGPNQNQILMSFTASTTISGVGTVDDSDIVKFIAKENTDGTFALGDNTDGTFEMYFDGSDVGLTTSDEDIDGLTRLQDGRLLISTYGSNNVTGSTRRDEDILVFNPKNSSWDIYFDGSDVELGRSGEDIVGVTLNESGDLYLSTINDFSAQGVKGKDEDVFKFTPTSLGASTQGTIASPLDFDGSTYGLDNNDIRGLDLPYIRQVPQQRE